MNYLETLKKIPKNFSQDPLSLGQNLNQGPPNYEVVSIRMKRRRGVEN
jgi:hypothetical protein